MGSDSAQQLIKNHGPLLGGEDLWRSLGFRNANAFRQAKLRGRLGVKVFQVEFRRGTYAFMRDVAEWLTKLEEETRARGNPKRCTREKQRPHRDGEASVRLIV